MIGVRGKKVIKLLKFGAPKIQNLYKDLCDAIGIKFEDFQIKLINDTGKSYDELKDYWIEGEEGYTPAENQLENFLMDNRLIIHFDTNRREILGIAADGVACATDGENFYEEEDLGGNRNIRRYR